MRFSFLLFLLFIFSACTTSPEISSSHEQSSSNKIRSNQSEAENAKNEYKALQEKRTSQ